jgi:hypothetical protein
VSSYYFTSVHSWQKERRRRGVVKSPTNYKCVRSYICVLVPLPIYILMYTCPHTTICVSSYTLLCVIIRLYMCPHTTVCVLILMSCVLIDVSSYYYMCPPTAQYVSSYCYMSSYYYVCVLILLYMCPHTNVCASSCCYVCPLDTICVLILLYKCPHTSICVLLLYVSAYHLSSYCYICALLLLYVSSYHYICVLMRIKRPTNAYVKYRGTARTR